MNTHTKSRATARAGWAVVDLWLDGARALCRAGRPIVRPATVALLVGVAALPVTARPTQAHADYTYYTPAWGLNGPYDPYTPLHPTTSLAIRSAARQFGVNYYWLLRIAECESGLNRWAYKPDDGGGIPAIGAFQFHPDTYARYAWYAGVGGSSPYDIWSAARVAAYMFREGEWVQWGCR